MMKLYRIVLMLVVALVSTVGTACPDPGMGEGGDPTPTGEVEEAVRTIAQGVCEGTRKCYGESFPAQMVAEQMESEGAGSLEECVDMMVDEIGYERLTQSHEEGRINLRDWNLDDCASELEREICSDEGAAFVIDDVWVPECREAFQGQQQPGDPCLRDLECEGRDQCEKEVDEVSDVCHGVCRDYEEVADPCGGSYCEPREKCGVVNGDETCLGQLEWPCETDEDCEEFNAGSCGADGLCNYNFEDFIEVVGTGESCTLEMGGEPVVQFCEFEEVCRVDEADDEPICRPFSGLGDECSEDRHCRYGLFCQSGDEEEPGECVEVVAEGEPCSRSAQCGALSCVYEESSDESGEQEKVCGTLSFLECSIEEE